MKEQLLAREREIAAVQARMQASYQDHVSETQQLQGKVSSTFCSAASPSGRGVGFGGSRVVFWRRPRWARGTRTSGKGVRPRDAPGPWSSREKRHMGASSGNVASLGAVGTTRHPPPCAASPSCSSHGLHGESKGAGGGINPCWVPLDPNPAGAAGEWSQHAAGSPAAGELHPEGCPQPGHQPDREQVRPERGKRTRGCPLENPGVGCLLGLATPFLEGASPDRGGSEEELAKWLLAGAGRGNKDVLPKWKGRGDPLCFGVTCADARASRQWTGGGRKDQKVLQHFHPLRGARTLKVQKKCRWKRCCREPRPARCLQSK